MVKVKKVKLEDDYTSSGLIFALAISVVIILVSIMMIYFGTPKDKMYAAEVNGEPILRHDYDATVNRMKQQYAQILRVDFSTPSGIEMMDTIKKNAIDSLIEREILLQAADDFDIKVDSKTVEDELNNIKKNNFGDDEESFRKALSQNNITLSKLREDIRNQKLVEKVKDKIAEDKIKITEEDKKKYFDEHKDEFGEKEQVKASHILVEDEKLANRLYQDLEKDKSKFAELAKKNSKDPGSKDQGGELGYFGRGQMVPEFENTAFALKNGEISKPVKTQFGYHIIKKEDYKAGKEPNYNDAKEQITAKIKADKSPEIIQNFVKEQKEKSKIEIYIDQIDEKPETVASPEASASPEAKSGSEPKGEQSAEPEASVSPEAKTESSPEAVASPGN